MFRVIIAGGRNFRDYELLVKTMDHLLSKATPYNSPQKVKRPAKEGQPQEKWY